MRMLDWNSSVPCRMFDVQLGRVRGAGQMRVQSYVVERANAQYQHLLERMEACMLEWGSVDVRLVRKLRFYQHVFEMVDREDIAWDIGHMLTSELF